MMHAGKLPGRLEGVHRPSMSNGGACKYCLGDWVGTVAGADWSTLLRVDVPISPFSFSSLSLSSSTIVVVTAAPAMSANETAMRMHFLENFNFEQNFLSSDPGLLIPSIWASSLAIVIDVMPRVLPVKDGVLGGFGWPLAFKLFEEFFMKSFKLSAALRME